LSLLPTPTPMAIAANVILEITNRVPGITRALLLYRTSQLVSFPFTLFYFVARLLTDRAYWSHFGERLGFLPQSFTRTKAGSIWLHAVSAGEVASAVPLIRTLQVAQPLVPIYLSTTTFAGHKAAERLISGMVDGIFYAPLDYVSCVRRTLRAIRPALLIVLETELWPNFYYETKQTGAALVIANGRISDRTWPRYRKLKWFFGPLLQLADAVFPQSSVDRDRYAQLGVRIPKLQSPGNLKYDVSLLRSKTEIPPFGADPIWICASTAGPNERGSLRRHSIDEDEIAIRAFEALALEFPHLLLILAPRQPARFDVVAHKVQRTGVNFLRWTHVRADPSVALKLPGVLLLDSIGDLAGAYPLAQAVFVGGSIAPRGGHNILEPAAAGVPIVVGPHMQNFEAVLRDFVEADAIVQVRSEEELLPQVRRLLADRAHAGRLAQNARKLIERQRGTSQRVAACVWPLFHSVSLRTRHNFAARAVLRSLAFIWRQGGVLKRHRYERYAASVPPIRVPVISIGAITVGGSGKTPFTTYLATRLRARGYSPAILTRGYRRRSPARDLIFPPGAKVPPAFTGDEAQIFLRQALGPIGIGANRYETAQFLLFQYPATDVIFLDDGFQHARVKRDFDIVVIDGLDPFGGEDVVPLGRLREPLDALPRADCFVVTRAQNDFRYEAICARLREYNPTAPVFRTRLVARTWHDYHTGAQTPDLPARRVAAFCGVGNPQNFWSTLESLGLEVVFRWEFEDHHAYKRFQLQRIAHQARAHGAQMLVTTEKDRINCPSHFENAIAPLDLAWLEIGIEVEEESAFLALLEEALRRRAAHSSSGPVGVIRTGMT
jgi:3-deoxy-D-manno-octulosonic-acid transferase